MHAVAAAADGIDAVDAFVTVVVGGVGRGRGGVALPCGCDAMALPFVVRLLGVPSFFKPVSTSRCFDFWISLFPFVVRLLGVPSFFRPVRTSRSLASLARAFPRVVRLLGVPSSLSPVTASASSALGTPSLRPLVER